MNDDLNSIIGGAMKFVANTIQSITTPAWLEQAAQVLANMPAEKRNDYISGIKDAIVKGTIGGKGMFGVDWPEYYRAIFARCAEILAEKDVAHGK